MENRLVALLAGLSIAVGFVFGALAGRMILAPPNATFGLVRLDASAQVDLVIAAAEAYANDGSLPLARDRLARLKDPQLESRVERLARDYAPHRDFIAAQLAHLAVALGSRNLLLTALDAGAGYNRAHPRRASPAELAQSAVPTGVLEESLGIAASRAELELATPSRAPSATPVTKETFAHWPGRTPTAQATPSPTRTPTNTHLMPTSAPRPSTPAALTMTPGPMPQRLIAATIPVPIPEHVGIPTVSIPLTARPAQCTPADRMPDPVDHTLALCPRQVYGPIHVSGGNLTIYGDNEGTSLVRGSARGFAMTVSGFNVAIVGVHVQAATDPADLNQWLCLYESCYFSATGGALGYGGGILLDHSTGASVASSFISGGTTGLAVSHGTDNRIVNNSMSGQNGWGVLLQFTTGNVVGGNQLDQVNRACMSLTGDYYNSGCESSGLAMIASPRNVIVGNRCAHTANCFYANGEVGFGSGDNKIYDNYCAAAGNNCFEFTFSAGNQFDYNTAMADPGTGDPCDYPVWIAGSTVSFGSHNVWSCKHDLDTAIRDSTNGTDQLTQALLLK